MWCVTTTRFARGDNSGLGQTPCRKIPGSKNRFLNVPIICTYIALDLQDSEADKNASKWFSRSISEAVFLNYEVPGKNEKIKMHFLFFYFCIHVIHTYGTYIAVWADLAPLVGKSADENFIHQARTVPTGLNSRSIKFCARCSHL